jgi:hypothetical protein
MDSTIRIYKNPWDDVSEILSVLHPYLTKYTILSSNDPRISKYIGEFPVVEFDGKKYGNPSAGQLKQILGLTNPPKISYSDLLIVGSGCESLFAMDYARKHNINVIGIGDIDDRATKRLDSLYRSVLKIPTLVLDQNFTVATPLQLTQTDNRMYMKLITDTHDYYARGVCIALTLHPKDFGFNDENILREKKIFYDTEGLFTRLTDKDLTIQKRRIIGLVGNDPAILRAALKLHQQLQHLRDGYTFDVLVITPRTFRKEGKGMLSTLLRLKHMKVLDSTDIIDITMKDQRVFLKTNAESYLVDYVLSYNAPVVESDFVETLAITDEHGYIETDITNKTKYPNIYALTPTRVPSFIDERVGLLDEYITCSQTIKLLNAYITGGEMF